MDCEITIYISCEKCHESFDINNSQGSFYCNECEDELYDKEYIKEALDDISNNDYEWTPDDSCDASYFDEPEKREAYFNGVKGGYLDALFWMADYFALDEFYDKEIMPKFKEK